MPAWTKLLRDPAEIAKKYKINSINEPNVAFKIAPMPNDVCADKLVIIVQNHMISIKHQEIDSPRMDCSILKMSS